MDNETDSLPSASRKGIQSINIGFSILAVLMDSAVPLPLKTISEKSGLSPSKIHSYLVSFTELGMVEQSEHTGFYSLGVLSLKLGLAYLNQADLFAVARPVMNRLAVEVGQTVFLGVWGNRGPTIVHRLDGPYSQTVFDLRIGSVLPLLSSALGRNFAAHLPEGVIAPLLQAELNNLPPSVRTGQVSDYPTSKAEAAALFQQVREQGVSVSRGLLLSDFTAISAPIFDYSHTLCAGLTIMGRTDVLDDALTGVPVNKLKAAAAEISRLRGMVASTTT